MFSALCLASGVTLAAEFDLSGLPRYVPPRQEAGTIRIFGSDLAGMVRVWEQGFRRYQPGVRFADHFPSSDAGIAGLVSGVSDLGPQAREQTVVEQLMFHETFGHAAGSVIVATGGYDAEGMADGLVIFVNESNPLARLTLAQLDGIFGAERTGALRGFKWNLKSARSAGRNIRTWGQLGLTGAWAGKAIHTYGYAPTGMSQFFQLNVLRGSDKWNPNFREYVESGTKMIADDDRAMAGGLHQMLARELSHDPYGIAFGVLSQASGVTGVKTVALARSPSGPYVAPSPRSFQDHSYPLSRNIYIYFNRAPGQPLTPCVREFLRYIVSRQGQEAVERKSSYLPLDAALARAQLRRIGGAGAH
ncbi:MAG: substrate-binding domain-containing protein [Gammaproteobacteria bacterium]|nr:substrate-binding domain-containing protein [Gammaproteobacteria bacterium]